MATIKYKDNEGNFHKVSIGGGSGTDEVYIGSDTPPKGTKVWIDPSGEGGGGSTTSGVQIYTIPEGVLTATESEPYVFTAEETSDFLAQGDFSNSIVRFTLMKNGFPQRCYVESTLYGEPGILVTYYTEYTAASNTFMQYYFEMGVIEGQGIGFSDKFGRVIS